jgi:histidine ammonia-lyase
MLTLDGNSLTPALALHAAENRLPLALAPAARERMAASRAMVEKILAAGLPVYGINTGFGALSTVAIAPGDVDQLQMNLVRSHASGVGPHLPEVICRLALILRLNTLARGRSGVRPEAADHLLALLNAGITPAAPEGGSVGASGDLAPLAHLTLPLIGEGEVYEGGKIHPAAEVLKRRGLAPLALKAKEGLAFINGTQVLTAWAILALHEAEELYDAADAAGALTLEALFGSHRAFDARIHAERNHPGQIATAAKFRALLDGGTIEAAHADCGKVQDAYSLRCIPQVHGAGRDALAYAAAVIGREINASTDNPLLFAEDNASLSGGNFHGAPVGYAADLVSIVLTDLAAISERRIDRLTNHDLSELPHFLIDHAGLNSGFMIPQVAAASRLSECRTLANPASGGSISTSAAKEDHVSMATWAARKAVLIAERVADVVAIELLCGAQGLDFRRPLRAGTGVEKIHAIVRQSAPFLKSDASPAPMIAALRARILEGAFS